MRESRTTKDLAVAQSASTAALAKQRGSAKKQKPDSTKIEVVGVYKFTRQQQKARNQARYSLEQSPQLSRKAHLPVSSQTGSFSQETCNTLQNNATATASAISSVPNSRPGSQMRQRLDRAYKHFCDSADLHDSISISKPKKVGSGANMQRTHTSTKQTREKLMLGSAKKAAREEKKEQQQQTQQQSVLRKRAGKSACFTHSASKFGSPRFSV